MTLFRSCTNEKKKTNIIYKELTVTKTPSQKPVFSFNVIFCNTDINLRVRASKYKLPKREL